MAGQASIRFRRVLDEGGVDLFGAAITAPAAALAPVPSAATSRPRAAPIAAAIPTPPPVLIPPPSAALLPAVATPPAFPYRVLGRYDTDGTTLVFLEGARGTEAVAVGQTLEGTWRIDAIGAQQMTVRFAPTNHVTSVSLLTSR